MRDVLIIDAGDESGNRFDVGSDRHLNKSAARVIGLQLEAALNRPCSYVCGFYSYSNDAGLTRLDDFLEIKVSGRASTRSRTICGYSNRHSPRVRIERNCFDKLARRRQAEPGRR